LDDVAPKPDDEASDLHNEASNFSNEDSNRYDVAPMFSDVDSLSIGVAPTSDDIDPIFCDEASKNGFKDSKSEGKDSNSAQRDWAESSWSAILVLKVSEFIIQIAKKHKNASYAYGNALKKNLFGSRKANCWDNIPTVRFLSTLKAECIE
jgi:hypothetical protein